MNGAEAILRTLADNGVEVCFTNPGTSEMQMVAAFDREPRVRPVLSSLRGRRHRGCRRLCAHHGQPGRDAAASWPRSRQWFGQSAQCAARLFANRQHCRRPRDPSPRARCAAHLGHRRARRIEPRFGSSRAETPDAVVALAAEAVAASQERRGGNRRHSITSCRLRLVGGEWRWLKDSRAGEFAAGRGANRQSRGGNARVEDANDAAGRRRARRARRRRGGRASRGSACESSSTHSSRASHAAPAAMRPSVCPIFGELASASLNRRRCPLALVATQPPVAFFAYPSMPNLLAPPGCAIQTLASREEDSAFSLCALADELRAPADPILIKRDAAAAAPSGSLTADAIGVSLARHMPERRRLSPRRR